MLRNVRKRYEDLMHEYHASATGSLDGEGGDDLFKAGTGTYSMPRHYSYLRHSCLLLNGIHYAGVICQALLHPPRFDVRFLSDMASHYEATDMRHAHRPTRHRPAFNTLVS